MKDAVVVSDFEGLHWIHNHHLQDHECNKGAMGDDGAMSEQYSRPGDFRPISLTDDEFNYIHPGVASGSSRQWVMGKLGPRRILAMVYAMVAEVG